MINWTTPVTPVSGAGTAAAVTVNEGCGSATGQSFNLVINKPNDGQASPTGDGYDAEFTCAGSDSGTVRIDLHKNQTSTPQVTSSAPFPLGAGTRVAFSSLGGVLAVWVDNGSGFAQVDSVDDSMYSGGYAGLVMVDLSHGQRLTNFAVGPFAP